MRSLIQRLIKWLRTKTGWPEPLDPYDDGWPDAAENGYLCWEEAVAELRKRQEAARKS